ncbi:MAG: glycine zipper 2TM domain-containing protein [Rhizobacter sp.]
MTTTAFPASGHSDGLYDPTIGPVLKSLLDRYGIGLLGESGRLRGLLHDDCPQAKREVSVLMQALEERVPQDLMRVHSGEPIQSLTPRLAKRLSDEKGMAPNASRWAVETWAEGLGLAALISKGPVTDDAAGKQGAQALFRSAANQAFDGASAPVPTPIPNRKLRAAVAGLALCGVIAFSWFGFLRPVFEITAVETQGPLVGDGKARPVTLAVHARHETVRNVEMRFVSGDGNWNTQTTTYPATGTASGETRIGAGTLAYRTAQPMTATFEYVLVSNDGTRSAPFQRTFSILPPIVITSVTAPRPLGVGRAFNVDIKYQKGSTDIVQIERRVVESSVPWPDTAGTASVQPGNANGLVQYPFDAAKQPMRSTLEFVLIDAQGVRSEPARMTLDIGTAANGGGGPAVVMAVQQVTRTGSSSGVGAVVGGVLGGVLGNQFGSGSGRTVATLAGVAGGAYVGNNVEKNNNSTSGWETTVKFDDGSRRTIRHAGAPTWSVGQRVVIDNGTITSAGN